RGGNSERKELPAGKGGHRCLLLHRVHQDILVVQGSKPPVYFREIGLSVSGEKSWPLRRERPYTGNSTASSTGCFSSVSDVDSFYVSRARPFGGRPGSPLGPRAPFALGPPIPPPRRCPPGSAPPASACCSPPSRRRASPGGAGLPASTWRFSSMP